MPKQIGWSNESNLLYQISQQITRLINVTGTSGGGGGGSITGSGTAGYISKWMSSSAIGNSLIYDNGVGIEINGPTKISTASQYVLEVGNSTGPTSTSTIVLGNAGYYYTTINAIRPGGNFATYLTFTTCKSGSPTAVEAMRITNDQAVWINRTTDDGTGAILQVNGTTSTSGIGVNGGIQSGFVMDVHGQTVLRADTYIFGGQLVMSNTTNSFNIYTPVSTGLHSPSSNHLPLLVNGVQYYIQLLN